MVGLTIYRILRASDGDTAKALLFFGGTLVALSGVLLVVVYYYRRAAATGRGLLEVLDGRYPGQAFAIFKTGGLRDDVSTLPVALRGAAWDKWTLYAVVTLDAQSITFWDGSAKKPVVTSRLDRSELRSIEPAHEPALLFKARALKIAVLHDGVMLRVTFSPARTGDWIFSPTTDSFTVLNSTLATSMALPPTT
ncbi:hypothetical protein JF66_12920 [Cryobacterium sp. MLB-32]|nr:hypothetical protein JF66_12920 [Cryobacterium sp. MLB-32]